jgi:protein SDA1
LQYTIEATGRYSIENISITLTYNLRLEGQIDAESEILTFELIPGGDQEDEFDEEDPTDEELNEEEVDEEDPTDEELNEEEIDEEDPTDEELNEEEIDEEDPTDE